MAFIAGGANVGGVQQVEAGELKYYLASQTPSGTGSIINELTVPAGKKWIIKILNQSGDNFTGTITNSWLGISPDGTTTQRVWLQFVVSSGSQYVVPQQLVLIEGGKIYGRSDLSVYTSGTIGTKVIVMESNL